MFSEGSLLYDRMGSFRSSTFFVPEISFGVNVPIKLFQGSKILIAEGVLRQGPKPAQACVLLCCSHYSTQRELLNVLRWIISVVGRGCPPCWQDTAEWFCALKAPRRDVEPVRMKSYKASAFIWRLYLHSLWLAAAARMTEYTQRTGGGNCLFDADMWVQARQKNRFMGKQHGPQTWAEPKTYKRAEAWLYMGSGYVLRRQRAHKSMKDVMRRTTNTKNVKRMSCTCNYSHYSVRSQVNMLGWFFGAIPNNTAYDAVLHRFRIELPWISALKNTSFCVRLCLN